MPLRQWQREVRVEGESHWVGLHPLLCILETPRMMTVLTRKLLLHTYEYFLPFCVLLKEIFSLKFTYCNQIFITSRCNVYVSFLLQY